MGPLWAQDPGRDTQGLLRGGPAGSRAGSPCPQPRPARVPTLTCSMSSHSSRPTKMSSRGSRWRVPLLLTRNHEVTLILALMRPVRPWGWEASSEKASLAWAPAPGHPKGSRRAWPTGPQSPSRCHHCGCFQKCWAPGQPLPDRACPPRTPSQAKVPPDALGPRVPSSLSGCQGSGMRGLCHTACAWTLMTSRDLLPGGLRKQPQGPHEARSAAPDTDSEPEALPPAAGHCRLEASALSHQHTCHERAPMSGRLPPG